jgi:hypothetical protein
MSGSEQGTMNKHPHQCTLCGARYPTDETCQDHFNLCLALEFQHPDTFGSVHHLTIPSYMLQHNLYSRAGWLEARQMLVRFLREGIAPTELRIQYRSIMYNGNRSWNLINGPKLAEFNKTIWTRTIADLRLEDPVTYSTDVRLWAQSILADTESLLLKK